MTKGRETRWGTGDKQVSFQVFPEGCIRGIVSYMEGERDPKNRGIVTKRVCLICELSDQRWGCEGT